MVEYGFMTEEQGKQSAILLMKYMYRDEYAAIKFFKVPSDHAIDPKKMNMEQSLTYICVFFKMDKDNKLIFMVGVNVDDCAITGHEKDIIWFMDGI
mmetsp:Transcript_25841/g.24708  ORF Transcript_25841/g.24708 Transcript_25841/m.24708 type:complete len:96 (-) Transcript_25841:266-553(-)